MRGLMTKERQKTACLLISQESPKLPSYTQNKRTKYILFVFYAARLFSFGFFPSVLFFSSVVRGNQRTRYGLKNSLSVYCLRLCWFCRCGASENHFLLGCALDGLSHSRPPLEYETSQTYDQSAAYLLSVGIYLFLTRKRHLKVSNIFCWLRLTLK